MAPKDSEYSLRELIRSQSDMLIAHMKDSRESNTAILLKLNSLEKDQQYTAKFFEKGDERFDKTEKRIGKLELSDRNQKLTTGLISAISGGVTGFIHTLFGGH